MLTDILLQAKPGTFTQQLIGFLPLIGIIIVFYFFMIRPQQKKAKEQKNFRDSIKKGDVVVTIGGLHGRVASVENDDTVMVEVDKGIKLKFERSSISMEASKKAQANAAKAQG
ncbi:MAG: preprotein translocase subunit YajC [Cytophagaceae bacterium]|nr:preprotein translocase subunit YajC [Cytophagaceae bacterium]MDW8456422.1 preprotein translocase subunit YajC [Cytophagaceae bacterium]